MKNNKHVYAVILAGGGGTRLWPKSRTETPKQFLKLTEQRTLMQVTADRITKIVDWDHIIVVTNKRYFDDVVKQLPKAKKENIISEPEKKDTALAMLAGAIFAKNLDPEAIVINAASDHVVTDENEFARVMDAAVQTASDNKHLVTVGITPAFPTSALGYIKIGKKLKELDTDLPLYEVANFTEKPDIETAKAFIKTGEYFWNANMYVWSAEAIQQAFKAYMPTMYEATKKLESLNPEQFYKALPDIYKNAEGISIDYAVSEKADNLVLIPGDFGWSDVGDWKVVYDLGQKDADKNVIAGVGDEAQIVSVDSHGNLIHTNNSLIALVGLKDMVIVDTGEILMICPKDRTQEVKQLVKQLKENNRKEYL